MTEQLMRRGALSAVAFVRRYLYIYLKIIETNIYIRCLFRLLEIIDFMKYLYFDRISPLFFFFKLSPIA